MTRVRPLSARRLAAAVTICASVALPSGSGALAAQDPCADPDRTPATAHVHVVDGGDPFFDPFETIVCRGDRVGWDNHSDRIHTVTHVTCQRADSRYDDCEFDSVFTLTPGTTFEHPFTERSGVFDYKCTIHGFTGRIVVLDEAGALPDLSVASLAAYDTVSPATKRLQATLRNTGEAASSTARVSFEYQNLDGAWIMIGEPKIGAINAGTTLEINQSWLVANKIGDFPVRVHIDAGRNVLEADEGNNALLETMPVWLPAGIMPGVALPEPP